MNKKNQMIAIIGVMCMLLTSGICIQIRSIEKINSKIGTNATANNLRDEILKLQEKYNNKYSEVEKQEEKIKEHITELAQSNAELEKQEEKIQEANKKAGLSEVTGSGIVLVLQDSTKTSKNAGSTSSILTDSSELLIHDATLINIINELINQGAEAISINDERIISTTAIECDGGVVKVNGKKISVPFEIKAIGYPEQLAGIYRAGGYIDLEKLEEKRMIKSFTKSNKITIPKYSGVVKFNYATVVK